MRCLLLVQGQDVKVFVCVFLGEQEVQDTFLKSELFPSRSLTHASVFHSVLTMLSEQAGSVVDSEEHIPVL